MKKSPLFLVGRIILPLAITILFDLSPTPLSVNKAFVNIRTELDRGQPAAAIDSFQQVLGYYPWRGDLLERLGMTAFQAGHYNLAIQNFLDEKRRGSLSMAGYIWLGDAYAESGEPQQAIQTWEFASKHFGESVELFKRLEKGYQKAGDYDNLRRVLSQWAALKPVDSKIVFRLGLWQATHQPGVGLSTLISAADLDSGLESSLRILQAGINAGSVNGDLAYQLMATGRAMGSLGEWETAIEAFRQSLQLKPDNADVWAFLSQAQQRFGVDGQPALRHALEINPDSVVVKGIQALYFQQLGELDQAFTYLNSLASLEPNNGLWQVELGNIAAQKSDLAAAMDCYQKAVAIDPNNPFYWRALAGFTINFNVEISQVGLPAARQAVILGADDPANLDILGQALAGVEDLTTAERLFLRALSQDPQYAPAYLHLGVIYLSQGKKAQAIGMLNQALLNAPSQAVRDQAQRILDRYNP